MIRQPFESDDYAKACHMSDLMRAYAAQQKKAAVTSGHIPTVCFWSTVEELLMDKLLLFYLYPLIREYYKTLLDISTAKTQDIPSIPR